jgi:putative heme-binding domain-containing protein
MNYVIDLPWNSSNKTMLPETSIRTDLNGVNATWTDPSGKEQWRGWLPHADLAVAREFTRGSAEHEQFFSLIQKKGALVLTGQLDLYQMLQPGIQPGSTIDWERPSETVQVHVTANAPFELSIGTSKSTSKPDGAKHKSTLEIVAPGQKWQPFQSRLAAVADPQIEISWSTSEDSRLRAFPLRRFLLPWAEPDADTNAPATRPIPEIAGGNSSAGKTLFFSDKLACAKCHSIGGEGGKIAPDLSNLIYRDYASVQKDIQFPSAALNPDHIASIVELNDGEPVSGIIQKEEKGKLYVAIASGQVQEVAKNEVRRIKTSEVSLMPAGLWDGMNESERRDLMTFLLTRKVEEKQAINR